MHTHVHTRAYRPSQHPCPGASLRKGFPSVYLDQRKPTSSSYSRNKLYQDISEPRSPMRLAAAEREKEREKETLWHSTTSAIRRTRRVQASAAYGLLARAAVKNAVDWRTTRAHSSVHTSGRHSFCRLPPCRVLVFTPCATVHFDKAVPRVLRDILADTDHACSRRDRRNCNRLRESALRADSEMREPVAARSPGRGLSPLQCFSFRVPSTCVCVCVRVRYGSRGTPNSRKLQPSCSCSFELGCLLPAPLAGELIGLVQVMRAPGALVL